MTHSRPIRTVLFSTLYPSSVRPGHGIFVETRLKELLKSGQVQTKVIAPVPWFFSTSPKFGIYAQMAKTPKRELYQDVDVLHPRYFLPPKVGMNLAPLTLAMGARSALQSLLNEGFDFDLIDAHYYYPDGVAAALLASIFHKPFTVTARGSDINLISKYAIPRGLMRWTSKRAYASIGVSRALTEAMNKIGMPKDRLCTMRNGIDLDRFNIKSKKHARTQLGWPDQATLICVGNLVENKGQHIAIQALLDLPDFRLVIAGEGPERSALQTLAQKLGVSSRVLFIGRIEQRALSSCYCAADILVLPSSREGWPNVLLESMACGTPVVATNVGGIPEIVLSPNAGRIMDARTAIELSASVKSLWADLPHCTVVRDLAESFSWRSTVDAQINVFAQIVANREELVNA